MSTFTPTDKQFKNCSDPNPIQTLTQFPATYVFQNKMVGYQRNGVTPPQVSFQALGNATNSIRQLIPGGYRVGIGQNATSTVSYTKHPNLSYSPTTSYPLTRVVFVSSATTITIATEDLSRSLEFSIDKDGYVISGGEKIMDIQLVDWPLLELPMVWVRIVTSTGSILTAVLGYGGSPYPPDNEFDDLTYPEAWRIYDLDVLYDTYTLDPQAQLYLFGKESRFRYSELPQVWQDWAESKLGDPTLSPPITSLSQQLSTYGDFWRIGTNYVECFSNTYSATSVSLSYPLIASLAVSTDRVNPELCIISKKTLVTAKNDNFICYQQHFIDEDIGEDFTDAIKEVYFLDTGTGYTPTHLLADDQYIYLLQKDSVGKSILVFPIDGFGKPNAAPLRNFFPALDSDYWDTSGDFEVISCNASFGVLTALVRGVHNDTQYKELTIERWANLQSITPLLVSREVVHRGSNVMTSLEDDGSYSYNGTGRIWTMLTDSAQQTVVVLPMQDTNALPGPTLSLTTGTLSPGDYSVALRFGGLTSAVSTITVGAGQAILVDIPSNPEFNSVQPCEVLWGRDSYGLCGTATIEIFEGSMQGSPPLPWQYTGFVFNDNGNDTTNTPTIEMPGDYWIDNVTSPLIPQNQTDPGGVNTYWLGHTGTLTTQCFYNAVVSGKRLFRSPLSNIEPVGGSIYGGLKMSILTDVFGTRSDQHVPPDGVNESIAITIPTVDIYRTGGYPTGKAQVSFGAGTKYKIEAATNGSYVEPTDVAEYYTPHNRVVKIKADGTLDIMTDNDVLTMTNLGYPAHLSATGNTIYITSPEAP